MLDRFKVLMLTHYWSIKTVLNAHNKLKYKRSVTLGNKYDRMSLWIFLSIMRSRNKDLFTWWAIILSAARYGTKSDSAGSFNESTYF